MRPVCWINVALGFWLFESRFFWVHSPSQFTNAAIVAVLYTSLAVAAVGFSAVRYVNAGIAFWLGASAFLLPRFAQGTLWNNLLVAVAMLWASAVSRPRDPPDLRQRINA